MYLTGFLLVITFAFPYNPFNISKGRKHINSQDCSLELELKWIWIQRIIYHICL